MKRDQPAPVGRTAKPGQRPDGGRDGSRGAKETRSPGRFDSSGPRRDARDSAFGVWSEAPRLGDTAFRAQRDALEHAQLALRKLAAQAHGEALSQLINAWAQRDSAQVPSVQELGSRVNATARALWVKALAQAPSGDAGNALLRLEMAAETPTPAEYMNARRMLQLQLLTKRNDPAPSQTWAQDTAAVLAAEHAPGQARRLQNVLKTMLK